MPMTIRVSFALSAFESLRYLLRRMVVSLYQSHVSRPSGIFCFLVKPVGHGTSISMKEKPLFRRPYRMALMVS